MQEKRVLPKKHITKSVYSGTWSRMKQNEVSVTITTRFDTPSSGKFTHPFLNRAITVREAARLQSFQILLNLLGVNVPNETSWKCCSSIISKRNSTCYYE